MSRVRKQKRLGSGDYQHVTLGDLRRLLKDLEHIDDEVELGFEIDGDEVDFIEGCTAVALEAELIAEELWITIEGE